MATKIPILLLFLFSLNSNCSHAQSWIKAGYHYTGNEFAVSSIDSTLFTHLICAFAYINSSTYHLSINSSTQQEFSTFTNVVKRKNPKITTFLSVWGGREDSSVLFSKLNQSSRRRSIRSSEMLESDDMQRLLMKTFSMGVGIGTGSGFGHSDEACYNYSVQYEPHLGQSVRKEHGKSSGKAVVGWLKLKAALRWGIFIRKRAAERRARLTLTELD